MTLHTSLHFLNYEFSLLNFFCILIFMVMIKIVAYSFYTGKWLLAMNPSFKSSVCKLHTCIIIIKKSESVSIIVCYIQCMIMTGVQ